MTTQGAFVWYELMTTDMAAAKAFYGSVVGWTPQDSDMPDMDYTLFKVGDQGVAGLMLLPDDAKARGVPPCWTGYVAVNDVDAETAAFAADGGKALKGPMDIPGVGRMSVVADPQGAVLCLFRGEGEMPAAPARGTPGYAGWRELMTSDLEAGFAFYAKHFGWTKDHDMDMGPMGPYRLFAHEGVPIGGMMKRDANTPVSYWRFVFNVAKIGDAVEKVKAGGGQVVHGPIEVPGGDWVAMAIDPQGAFFAVVGPQ